MELLTLTFSAGETKRIERAGRYFEIIDSTGPVRVDFYESTGRQSDQMLGAVSGLFLEEPYGAFVIQSASAQTVTLLVMESGRGGSRRQPGNVRVIDVAAEKTATGRFYSGSISTFASGSANIALRSTAFGRNLAVSMVRLSTPSASTVFTYHGQSVGAVGATDNYAPNNLIGQPNSQTWAHFISTGTADDTDEAAKFPASVLRRADTLQAGIPLTLDYSRAPLILPPGFHLRWKVLAQNVQLTASVEFELL